MEATYSLKYFADVKNLSPELHSEAKTKLV